MIHTTQPDPQEGSFRDLAPDLMPMLDILFILLVFFMLTAGIHLKTLDLALPSTANPAQESTVDETQLLLEIHADHYVLDHQRINTLAELETQIDSIHKDASFMIAADKHSHVERLLEILIYMQSKQVPVAHILMQETEK